MSTMTNMSQLLDYKAKADMELCLDLVQEAYQSHLKGNSDLAEMQLKDILETFDRINCDPKQGFYDNKVYMLSAKD